MYPWTTKSFLWVKFEISRHTISIIQLRLPGGHTDQWIQLSEVYQFDVEEEKWVEVGNMSTARSDHGASVVATHWIE